MTLRLRVLVLMALVGCASTGTVSAVEDMEGEAFLAHRPVRRGTVPGVRRPPALRPPRLTPNQTQFWMRQTVDPKVVEQTRQLYWRRLQEAKERYPNSEGYENHHVIPTYLVGTPDGTMYRLPTAYHKAITQEFRREWGYGQRRPDSERLMTILIRVYSKYPIPQLVGIEP